MKTVLLTAVGTLALVSLVTNFYNPSIVQADTITSPLLDQKPAKKAKNSKNEKFNIKNYNEMLRKVNPFYVLGGYSEVPEEFQPYKFEVRNYGLVNEVDYCDRVDFYNLNNPENIFEPRNFWTDFGEKEVPRKKIMDVIGVVSEDVPYEDPETGEVLSRLQENINSFFVQYSKFHYHHRIGRNFNCATQMYNHIPGQEIMTTKDQVVDRINSYIKKYEDRPQCFNKKSLFPYTYRLYMKDECEAFFSLINSQQYKDSLKEDAIQYVVKVGHGSHKSKGVFLMDPEETIKINNEYESGKKCGVDERSLLAQTYISRPLLLDLNNKFDFRVYMLIASTNPLIVYYHDGAVKASLTTYDRTSAERTSHLTNVYVADLKIKELKANNQTLNGMDENQLRDYMLWNFDRLEKYLISSGKTKDQNWLDNYLRPAFQKAFIHLVRMSADTLWKGSNVYSLQGADFMLDEDMNLWFIESNPSPLFTGTRIWKLFYSVVLDHFEVQFAYMKSRMKRALNVINKMQAQVLEGKTVNYGEWKIEYENAIKNRLEPEFQISKNNTWKLIMDTNLPAEQAYFGLISKECL